MNPLIDLPIKNPPIYGTAVDRLENRKDGTKVRFSEEEMARNFDLIKVTMIPNLRRLVIEMDYRTEA